MSNSTIKNKKICKNKYLNFKSIFIDIKIAIKFNMNYYFYK